MQLTLWAKSYSASINGSGIDLEIDLHRDDIQSLFDHFDSDEIVKNTEVSSLLDSIGQDAVEKHFDLCPMDQYKEMENRAIAAEEKLTDKTSGNKQYTDFEEL